jgi:dethiobiotin synthetase
VVRGCFVTGTDTGVGKTVVAACIAAALTARGQRVAAFKPVVTGLSEEPPPGWPHDHRLLALASGQPDPRAVSPLLFDAPASPHLAAALAGEEIDAAALLAHARTAADHHDVLVVEGVGGLLVPLSLAYSVRDLARDLGLPLVVAARPGLGTINHTLLTLEAARGAGLAVAAVVLTPWPGRPGWLERSNRETVATLGEVEVVTLPGLAGPDRETLARAGAGLPLDSWLGG